MPYVTRPAVPLLRFLGATETVTGSRFLVDTPHARVLVDCGLFQGLKALRLRNWEPFPIAAETIDGSCRSRKYSPTWFARSIPLYTSVRVDIEGT